MFRTRTPIIRSAFSLVTVAAQASCTVGHLLCSLFVSGDACCKVEDEGAVACSDVAITPGDGADICGVVVTEAVIVARNQCIASRECVFQFQGNDLGRRPSLFNLDHIPLPHSFPASHPGLQGSSLPHNDKA